jgi:hypothetical protein
VPQPGTRARAHLHGVERSSSRQHVESDATDPNNAAWSASTAMSDAGPGPKTSHSRGEAVSTRP